MALSKLKLLQTLSLLSLFLMLANKVNSQDVTSFTFDEFDPKPANLTYQGDAHGIPSGSKPVRLTRTDSSGNPQRASVGRVLYSRPVQFWDAQRQATFETTIRFAISATNNNPADGIAFFIAPVGSTIPSGSSGGNLGIFGSSGTGSNIFAVEFDTYVNGQWDPNHRHIGIDINSRRSRNVTRFDNALNQVVTARINYNSNTRVITVVATTSNPATSTTLSYVTNLRTILPQRVQVGISASTGEEVAIHDILSWYFTSSLVWDGVNGEDTVEDQQTYIRQSVI